MTDPNVCCVIISPWPHLDSVIIGVSASNHTKRLGSEMCRQEWIPAKRSGSSISLSTLAVFHSKRFPLNVMVIKGVEDKIPSMRIMNVHFLKHTSVSIIL